MTPPLEYTGPKFPNGKPAPFEILWEKPFFKVMKIMKIKRKSWKTIRLDYFYFNNCDFDTP